MGDIYSDLLIENYKNPKNWGVLKNYTHRSKISNSLCGDDLDISLLIQNDRLKDIKYTGSGCAICLGTMSILSEYLIDRHIKEIKELNKAFILELINMNKDSGRIKCATLSLDGVHKCINM